MAHGLNAKPAMILVKDREQSKEWVVYHKELGPTKFMYLNTDAAPSTLAYAWNNTEPNSNVWTMQDFSNMNSDDKDYVAYCWSEVAGYSKFGAYRGTELADPSAAFVWCGFRPAWIMVKNIGAQENWLIWDNKRDGYNPVYKHFEITPVSAQNATTNDGVIDILSNGFKIRVQYSPNNANTYAFAAFAESPFKYANAV